jgi:HK97 family phage portal protein
MKNLQVFKDSRFKTTIAVPSWADNQLEGGGTLAALAKAYAESTWTNRCISIRANLLSSIPWCIRPIDDDENEPIEDHELVDLIKNMDDMTNWEDAIRSVESDMDIFGVAYILKMRAGAAGVITGLRRLNPTTMEVIKSSSGIEGYIQTLNGKQKVEIPAESMIYFHEYHPLDDLGGLSMTAVALPSITALTNTEKYLSAFFENSALPAIIMTTEQTMQEADFNMLQRWWNKTFKGTGKAHKVAFLSNGVKPETISYPLTDLALEQVRETCRRDICGVFGVPPSIAGAWESANYATALEERKSIYTETIIPRARYYASQINTCLVQEIDPTVEFAWMFEELEVMQPDKKADAERLSILVNSKIITPVCAALEMGYSEEDVPEEEEPAPIPEQLQPFTGMPPEAPNKPNEPLSSENEAEMPSVDESQFKAEIGAWRRKALRTFKTEQKADCEFLAQYIPDALHESIKMQLDVAETIEDIRAVFDGARLYDDGKRKRVKAEIEDDIREETLSRIVVRAPDVTVNVNPTPVTVNVEQPNIKVAAPIVNIPEIKMPEIKIPKIEEPKPRTRKVKRDPQTQRIVEIVEE